MQPSSIQPSLSGAGSVRGRRCAHFLAASFILVLLLGAGGTSHAQVVPPAKHGSVVRIKVHGASLEGNLEGDSPDRDVSIYLPPSYATDPSRRYPVVYLLHGFTDTDLQWFGPKPLFDGRAAADQAFSADVPDMIIVTPDAKTRFFGSMYSSSVTVGDWETFVAHDLVAYVDSHYRTLAARESRGLAGHSMGGYGTLRVGMKHPDVFSSLYALSACCLTPPPDLRSPAPLDPARAKAAQVRTPDEVGAVDFWTKATLASAAAWSPDPARAPLFIDLPWQDGQVQPSIADKWAANSPLVFLDQYIPNLKRLKAIAVDVGTADSLLPGVRSLDAALTRYGVAHSYETYDGDHLNRIASRFQKNVLPFFAHNLEFEKH